MHRTDATRELREAGAIKGWRDELYPITDALHAPPVALIERAAAPYFGIKVRACNCKLAAAPVEALHFSCRFHAPPVALIECAAAPYFGITVRAWPRIYSLISFLWHQGTPAAARLQQLHPVQSTDSLWELYPIMDALHALPVVFIECAVAPYCGYWLSRCAPAPACLQLQSCSDHRFLLPLS